MQRGRLLVQVPDVARPDAVDAGPSRACRSPGRPDRRWASTWCRRSAPACGSSSSRAIPTTRSGSAAAGARRRRAAAGARGPAGLARTSCCRRRCRTRIVISDLPGPTGGIMLKSTTGATLIVNDTGIYIQNGKGASIIMTGPTVDDQQRRADGRLRRRRCPDPSSISAPPCCARTAARRTPTAPNPRVLVSGQPVVDDRRAVRRRRLRRSRRPAGNGPCVTGAVGRRRDARARRTASRSRSMAEPVDLRADRHAAAAGRRADRA